MVPEFVIDIKLNIKPGFPVSPILQFHIWQKVTVFLGVGPLEILGFYVK
jgi:hypothetical protein